MSTQASLASAINAHVSVEVVHKGHNKLISPIRMGWKTTKDKGKHLNLFCYQFGGYSSRGLEPHGSKANFRCWEVKDISSVLPINAPWHGTYSFGMKRSECIDDVISGPLEFIHFAYSSARS